MNFTFRLQIVVTAICELWFIRSFRRNRRLSRTNKWKEAEWHLQANMFLSSWNYIRIRCTRWRTCLRHYAKSWKVAGSIPDGVNGTFHWHNPFGRTMALRVHSASNRNDNQEYFLGGKGSRCLGLTALPPSCADYLETWESQPPGTLWACPGR
jgi:hypothetical protein